MSRSDAKPTYTDIRHGARRLNMADDNLVSVIYPADAGEVAIFAAHGLAESLSAMIGGGVAALAETASAATSAVLGPYLWLDRGRPRGAVPDPAAAAEPGPVAGRGTRP